MSSNIQSSTQNQSIESNQVASPKQNETQQQSPTLSTNMSSQFGTNQHSALSQQILYSHLLNSKQGVSNLINPALTNPNLIGLNGTNYSNFVNLPFEQPNQQIHAQLIQNYISQTSLQSNQLVQNNDEHHLYEYMQQLLEEKEKFKEIFNESFNVTLPICSKLLDEGNYFRLYKNSFIMIRKNIAEGLYSFLRNN